MSDRIFKVLRDSEASLRDVIETSTDAMMVVQASGVISFANPAAQRLIGHDRCDLVGGMLGIPLSRDACTEIEIPGGDHDVRVAEMRVVEASWDGERAFLTSLRDITDRKYASETLRFIADASRELAGSLDVPKTISSVASLAVAHLADWCIIDLVDDDNANVRRVAVVHAEPEKQALADSVKLSALGLPSSSAIAQVLKLGEPKILSRISDEALEALSCSAETRIGVDGLGCKSAMIVPLQARGRVLGAMTFVSAVSMRRYGATELAIASDLAHRAALALDNAMLYDIAQVAVRRRDEFLAMLAHELRNPLAAIQSAVDVMGAKQNPQSVMDRARDVIGRQGQQMARLLDDLLDIARVMRGKIELRLQEVDLVQTIHNSVQTIGPMIEKGGHELIVSVLTGPVMIKADPTRLEQILVNLLSNACKYTTSGGKISIEATTHGDEVVVSVSDNGDGIAAENLSSVFDLFMQANRGLARSEGGLGIGLTLVRQLVEMHGGRVQAFSEGRHQGARFVVHLPILSQVDRPAVHSPVCNRQQQLNIVIVEDNADTREMLQCLLTLEGHSVEVAEDGLCGVEAILRTEPDVALVDIGLPGLDGLQIAQRVRATIPDRKVRLVAVSGYGQAGDIRRSLESGFDHHLVKPVKHDELTAVIKTLCSPAIQVKSDARALGEEALLQRIV